MRLGKGEVDVYYEMAVPGCVISPVMAEIAAVAGLAR